MAVEVFNMMDEENNYEVVSDTSTSTAYDIEDDAATDVDEEMEVAVEKIQPEKEKEKEENDEKKEETEDPLKIVDKEMNDVETEEVVEEKKDDETVKEDEEIEGDESENEEEEEEKIEENLEEKSAEKVSEEREMPDIVHISDDDDTEDENDAQSDPKKSTMISLPFVDDQKSEPEKNIEENKKTEMIKLSNGTAEEKTEPVKKAKKPRKQEIIKLPDMENVRGILPDYDTSVVYEIIERLPIMRRCIIEHSYFKNELYNTNIYDIDEFITSRTAPYINKRRETNDGECLSIETLDSISLESDQLKNSSRSSSKLSGSIESDTRSFEAYNQDSDSDDSVITEEDTMLPDKPETVESKLSGRRIPILPKPPELIKIRDDNSLSLDDIDKELTAVERYIQKKSEIPMPKLTKMVNNEARMVNCNMPMPVLKKMPTLEDDKMRGEILDQILTKASEMNAKNFKKALERERLRRHESSADTSEEKTEKIEPSPIKKPEIKVKTVENINEELKQKELELGKRSILRQDRENEEMKLYPRYVNDDQRSLVMIKSKDPVLTPLKSSPEKKQVPVGDVNPPEASEYSILNKNKPILMPYGFKSENYKAGTCFRLLNHNQSGGKVYQVLESDKLKDKKISIYNKAIRPKIPGMPLKIYPNSRSYPYPTKKPKDAFKPFTSPQTFPVKSIEQKITPPPPNTRFVKLVPYEPAAANQTEVKTNQPEVKTNQMEVKTKPVEKVKPLEVKAKPVEEMRNRKIVSLYSFSNILKSILPDSWLLAIEPRYGLQILKTQLDEMLNPTIMFSVVFGRSGKVKVNVRGRQLDKSHDIFLNLGQIANSEGKLSLFYVLSLIEKLKLYSVCCGCEDLSLKKYWTDEGVLDYYNEAQQTYRSQNCDLFVHLNKKRCYACHRLNEKLKKRQRKELGEKKIEAPSVNVSVCAVIPKPPPPTVDLTENEIREMNEIDNNFPLKNLKRNILDEESFEESFSSIKQKITDEIEKRKIVKENENIPKTQEEVLSFMGLARKDSLDKVAVRKSKREKKSFQKYEPSVGDINVSQNELDFLEKYWTDINTLFSTSMLFGAYSRTGSDRLRQKCVVFHNILKSWKKIIQDNPDWIGNDLIINDDSLDETNGESVEEKFDKMNISDLRQYLMNAVKEVGKVKCRLKTKNQYFKCLYNKYVKRRAKRQKKEGAVTGEPVDNTDESSREKDDKMCLDMSKSQEVDLQCLSDGE